MSEGSEDKEIKSTDLSKHKRDGSILKPPFRQLTGMTPASWKDDRLPEMLWATLLVGNLKREEALDIFRKVALFVKRSPELCDVTQSGMAKWSKEKRLELLNLLKNSHPDTQKVLQSIAIFTELPAHPEWVEVFGSPSDERQVADHLARAVQATLWHQSQGATDCRWIRFLCEIHGGKIKFSNSIEGIHETLRGVLEYPNYGDLRHIRPFIRSSEISMNMRNGEEKNEWPKRFWKACLQSTICSPFPRREQRKDAIRVSHDQVNRIRHLLLLHYLKTDESSDVEPRHDSIFGLGFYALRLVDELVATNLSRGVIGRIVLRSIVECYITLAYLIKKDDPKVWKDFRDYGIGKMKLSYLKTRDLKDKPSFIDEEFLKDIANEDRWEEFSDIELSHWASSDLRKMSEEADCKDLYDTYYDWTSSFSHGNWGAIRESSFAICANPLHRLHLMPSVNLYVLPGVLEDVVRVTNLTLQLIGSQYSDLDFQITNDPKPPKIPWYKEIYYRFRYRKTQKFFDFITRGE
ncbi:hypothetical protein A2419_01285 [Candidatus Adlerbacteria bacterium RIFOXYC1_FULL_48_26]|uniref:Uncharacterized protein n=1 Tax=Candidatus Adlerbacteria bacterium RIFOXYC1_FULL_48_26 TaxID=1797247 RepID=A0A1F4Y2F9_9BACT|nr:MAG: hypothetical protein A2419_01285 [Candidatus Adlerbacteria bacterium RIFOXYC1_FULL_48_26]OGC93980.1 MAG: hypothetical protein A2389_00650 [Candidatus Adlerbacteria bacterium RIFOXYB1_FULL_48_10]OGC95348.1 MAG: hypothetical protein A2590_02500 [Candidatus Adlerbacteria bacterium RIFOXYD1_FULL_48_8]